MAGKNFIAKKKKKPGQLHRDLHLPQGQKIPEAKLRAAAKRGGKVGARARFAETLKGISAKRKTKAHKNGRLTPAGKHDVKMMAGRMLNYGKGKAN